MAAVTGTYRDAQGDPAAGYIRFTLKPAAVNIAGEQVVCTPVYGILDPDGRLSIDLIPDSELVVDGVAVYEVAEYLDGCHRTWHLALLDDQPVDLPSRYPGDTVGYFAVLPVPGPQGPEGERGPQGEPGQDGSDGIGAEWGTASTWAALPSTGNRPGRKVHVLDGLGLCLAVWDGTGWRVDEQSDTGVLSASPVNGWTGQVRIRRAGSIVHVASTGLDRSAATSDTFYISPVGFRPQVNALGAAEDGSLATGVVLLRSGSANDLRRTKWVSPGTSIWFSASAATADPWPTTPPA